MVIVWSPDWDNKLLVAIWETCGSKFDWETTAEIVGSTCTAEAIMQHLRTITRRAAERRREQRQILLEAHAARAASVAKGKAKRKWGYKRRNALRNEIKDTEKILDASSSKKKKHQRRDDSPLFEPVDDDTTVAPSKNPVKKRSRKGSKPKDIRSKLDDWVPRSQAEDNQRLRAHLEASGVKFRRGTFWNNYEDAKKR
ncbi:hypothetical protein PDE_04555 [Penicillium oxalicum 114-2]|uniref:Uncharacterized protein n=1 Tax=Penicillium oxalicum (strain 114-2 / CGMCC 5302) TaxID=933388 RepID=S7ZFZ2_PENO1|nr:hypothetical protein PDE_04555 [Penicillium oxalicum 114-2]